MELNNLPKTKTRKAKRVGRGIGSGKGGHTSGRGTKGQKARGKVGLMFEGTKAKKSFVKRLPFLRGRGKLKAWGTEYLTLNLDQLTDWNEKLPVTLENLIKAGVVRNYHGETLKLLGRGEVKKKLEVKVKVSKPAQAKIEGAGGKVS